MFKNTELSKKGLQLLRARREGEKVRAELEEQTGNVRRLQLKLNTALVRLFMECLWNEFVFCFELFLEWERESKTAFLHRNFLCF